MFNEKMVLCGASAYEKKYYLNEQFSNLPEQVKQELQIMCVLFTGRRRRNFFTGVSGGRKSQTDYGSRRRRHII